MTRYIEAHRARFGVEPICRVLQVAPSTYYAARRRPPSARRLRDEALKPKLKQVHAKHFGVYGVRKLWPPLHRRLAYRTLAPYRPRAQRPGAGAVGAQGALRRARASLGPRRAVPLD